MSYFALIPNNQFKRDAKKRWEVLLSAEWMTVAHCLMNGSAMPEKHRDHALSGDWQGCRECHIKPDLLLIYEIRRIIHSVDPAGFACGTVLMRERRYARRSRYYPATPYCRRYSCIAGR
ncbi:type II toxin-antitoxin system YafQ family toxin [Cardiobacterium sp. Marseille-Q4385]|uniref:type II toxin-antitoxin system YafQ family toxin n=1 Tax=Cardiobacterium sp. Marseille-Q4385 TaxID=2866573 RepID=UPI001CE3BF23|nr:type II toxin-antitoxin system YafQ family toxin [Cardiobacterium sp. Marseille-Q4385]